MATTIKLKRSDVPGKRPGVDDLELGEVAINTHEGRMFLKVDQDGETAIREVGGGEAANVYYVSESGDDDNDGKTLSTAFRTIHQALSVAQAGNAIIPGDTIFVKSGNHIVNNPVVVPAFVSIIGDNLRTTFVRPQNETQDLFHVNKGCYINGFTFKGHRNRAAVVSFPPDGSAGEITTSPYVQNCSSITSDGVGMRIDGSLVTGLRSMVCDAFTQINVGGVGVHILNRGYAQLVSIFTITCDVGILCETGGQCSITNSNCSFGNYGLYATGVSDPLYTATLVDSAVQFNETINVSGVAYKPSYGDAFKIDGINEYFTVNNSTTIFSTENSPFYTQNEGGYDDAAAILLANDGPNEYIANQVITWITANYPDLVYNQTKCRRDVGHVIDALAYDLENGGYSRTKEYARLYWTGTIGTFEPQRQGTSDAIRYIKSLIDDVFDQTAPGMNVNGALTAEAQAYAVAKSLIDNFADDVSGNHTAAAAILNNNKDKDEYVANKVIQYVAANFPSLQYDSDKCRRDIRFIFEAVAADIVNGAAEETERAARYYWNAVKNTFESQRVETADAIRYITTLIPDILNPELDSNREPVNAGIVFDSDLTIAAIADSSAQREINTLINKYADAVEGQYLDATQIIYNNLLQVIDSDDNPEPTGFTKPGDIATSTGVIANAVIEYIGQQVDAADSAGDIWFGFSYDSSKCRRDVSLILDAVADDMRAGGVENSEWAARQYWINVASTFEEQRVPTAEAVRYIGNELIEDLLDQNLTTFPDMVKDSDLTAEYNSKRIAKGLILDIADAIDGNLQTTVTVEPAIDRTILPGTTMTFHQRSLITASSITFEYVGTGIDITKADPKNGGIPIQANEIVQDADRGGEVYFTSTDQRGDFRIGEELTINRQAGTITGTAFDRSLFAVLTPYILALED